MGLYHGGSCLRLALYWLTDLEIGDRPLQPHEERPLRFFNLPVQARDELGADKQIQAYVFDLLELQTVQISENLRGPRWLEPEEMNQLSRDLTSDQPQNRR